MTHPHIGIRADASPTIGVGHVVRCLALAEELIARGCRVTLLGSVTVAWLQDRISTMGLTVVPATETTPGLVSQTEDLRLDALVIDGYELDPSLGASARAHGLRVLALHDGDFGAAQEADLHLDQNFGARPHPAAGDGSLALAGLDYALFRHEVLALGDEPRPDHPRPHVLAVFGGTDPHSAVEVVAPLVLATDVPLELTCIVARPELQATVEALPHSPSQVVRAIAPTPDVMAIAARSTLTVSAAGSSIWELLYLGVPTGIVAVADNQESAYADVTEQGVAAPVGLLTALRASSAKRDDATATLRRLLSDTAYRHSLSEKARRLVDGRGRQRVVDLLLDGLDRPPR